MKVKENFILREIKKASGESSFIVIAVGKTAETFKGYLTLNDSGAFIYKMLEKGVESVNEIVASMKKEYDAPTEIIEKDVLNVVKILKDSGVIDG